MNPSSLRLTVALYLGGAFLQNALGWAPLPGFRATRSAISRTRHFCPLNSSPFEAGFFGDKETFNPYLSDKSTIAVDPDTKLVLGFNKYSHDTTICAADSETGEVLFAMSKERLSRKKHDSGNVATLVDTCLEALELDFSAIQKVVVNNHHHRALPLEKDRAHMEWECGLRINGGVEDGYDDEENILGSVEKLELSHHLAHAYSAATQSPFNSGIVVVMDGMGETYRTMLQAHLTEDKSYTSDFSFGMDSFQCIPSDLEDRIKLSIFDWREAESVYVFKKYDTTIDIKPVFKRFQEESTPPTLYNHGFENMDSVGALYSRASSHIFGDWNACGKVMGLAPWIDHKWKDEDGETLIPVKVKDKIMKGSLFSEDEDEKFQIDRSSLKGAPIFGRTDPDMFNPRTGENKRRYDFDDYGKAFRPILDEEGEDTREIEVKRTPTRSALEAIGLAARIQDDLEEVVIDFVGHFKKKTGMSNMCLVGGVALNSVLNGRLCREFGFENTFIPPYPGDDGVAVGCCAFGLYGNPNLKQAQPQVTPPIWEGPLSPYQGPSPTENRIMRAIEVARPWITYEKIRKDTARIERIVNELEVGGVVALFQGRSEIGPRALGHRSILADPRKKGLVRFINENVKEREIFRPFAPSVLAEEASKWFHLEGAAHNNVSPYMSITAQVNEVKAPLIPAITHIDGSSRLQTVTKESDPFYYKLIAKFFRRTKVPMVLNTSFNTLPGEPITETPTDAIRSFLYSLGSIDMLVIDDYVIRRKEPDLKTLTGEGRRKEAEMTQAAKPLKKAGQAFFETTYQIEPADNPDSNRLKAISRVRMPSRPSHHDEKNNWYELLDELEGQLLSICDGETDINDIMQYFTNSPEATEVTDGEYLEVRTLFEQITRRLLRLHEQNFIYW